MPLTLQQVKRKWREARSKDSAESAFMVNCWFYHRHGGKGKMEICAEDGKKLGVYHCHDCGKSGNVYYEFPEWFDPLSETHPELFVARETVAPEEAPHIRRGGPEWAPGIPAPGETLPLKSLVDDHPAIQYLFRRGFNLSEIKDYDPTREIFYCTKGHMSMAEGKGSTTGRLVFPIYMLGQLRGWQARMIDYVLNEDEVSGEKVVWNGFSWQKFKKIDGVWQDKYVPKYYTCPGMKRASVLYGFDMADIYREVSVVEGPLDYHRTGPNCVGVLGNKGIPSFEQMNMLKTHWERVFMLRDPGVDRNEPKFQKLLVDLTPVPVFDLCLANGKDPGATPRGSTWAQIEQYVLANGGAPLLKGDDMLKKKN